MTAMIIIIMIIFLVLYFNNFASQENLTNQTVSSNEGLQNLSSVYNTGNATLNNLKLTGSLTIGNLTIDSNGNITTTGTLTGGNTTVNGHIVVTNGGDFSGGRYHFNDVENCGALRVGCAWGKPGIYTDPTNCSTCSNDIVIGSNSSNVVMQNGSTYNSIGSPTFNESIKIGVPGSDYMLWGRPDGFRISSGPVETDTQRVYFSRNPGIHNLA